jgi:hypothetical protein
VDASVVERAIAAAVKIATEQGLRVTEAIPVGTGSNVIVHLRPSPVVARVMTGTVVLHPDPHAWLTREIDVGAFLGERMTSVVAPTKEIDPGPYVSGNQWMSFWEHVEVRNTPLEAFEIGRTLRALHDALAEYRGPLPPRSAVADEIDWLLNALATSSGPRWNDFEDVCVGRVEWDVAGVLSDARAAHGDAFSAAVLGAYGGECDQAALDRVDQVHALYGALWRRYRIRRVKRPTAGERGLPFV